MMPNTTKSTADPLMTTEEVAEYLSLAVRTIKRWREEDAGPQYIRISHKCVRYRRSEVDRWLSTL